MDLQTKYESIGTIFECFGRSRRAWPTVMFFCYYLRISGIDLQILANCTRYLKSSMPKSMGHARKIFVNGRGYQSPAVAARTTRMVRRPDGYRDRGTGTPLRAPSSHNGPAKNRYRYHGGVPRSPIAVSFPLQSFPISLILSLRVHRRTLSVTEPKQLQ